MVRTDAPLSRVARAMPFSFLPVGLIGPTARLHWSDRFGAGLPNFNHIKVKSMQNGIGLAYKVLAMQQGYSYGSLPAVPRIGRGCDPLSAPD